MDTNENPQTLGHAIRRWREEQGFGLRQAAAMLSSGRVRIGAQTLQDIERDRRLPSAPRMRRIMEVVQPGNPGVWYALELAVSAEGDRRASQSRTIVWERYTGLLADLRQAR